MQLRKFAKLPLSGVFRDIARLACYADDPSNSQSRYSIRAPRSHFPTPSVLEKRRDCVAPGVHMKVGGCAKILRPLLETPVIELSPAGLLVGDEEPLQHGGKGGR